jgi:hypothetical protein
MVFSDFNGYTVKKSNNISVRHMLWRFISACFLVQIDETFSNKNIPIQKHL